MSWKLRNKITSTLNLDQILQNNFLFLYNYVIYDNRSENTHGTATQWANDCPNSIMMTNFNGNLADVAFF